MPRMKDKKNLAIGCLGLLVALFMCAYYGSTLQNNDQAITTDAPAAVAPSDATSGPTIAAYDTEERPTAAPSIGTEVAVGDSRVWAVLAVEDKGQEIQSGNQFIPNPKTSGRFLLVNVGVGNNGDDSFYIETPKVVDDAGREFDANSDAYFLIGDDHKCLLEELNPGLIKACAWVYEVPADATGLKLRVGGALFDDPALIDMGQ